MYEDIVRTAIQKIKSDGSLYVHGQNPDLMDYYNIWKGKASWKNYKYHLPDGSYKDAQLMSLNLPRYICREWANNYANEGTVVSIPNEKPNERLQEIFLNNNFFGKFNNFVESFFGLGIGATVINANHFTQDEEGNIVKSDSDVTISFVGGRRVVPITVDNGEVTECAFLTFNTNGVKMIIHYINEKGKYSIAELIGKGRAGAYTIDYDNIYNLETDSEYPLFQVWHPNVTVEDDITNEIGTSVFAQAVDSFKQCDLDYTALYKEIKLGQKVKFITSEIIKVDANGKYVQPFDEDDESIIAVEPGTDGTQSIQEVNGELRIDALVKALNFNMNNAAALCGLGQKMFKFEGVGESMQTATGIIAQNSELYRNVIKQENFATDKFRKMVYAIAYVNNTFTNNENITIDKLTDINVVFDDNIVEDKTAKRAQDLQEVSAGIMSSAEYRAEWYDETIEEATKYLQENAMLIDKYLLALQAGAMTVEKFCELVYGKVDNQTILYITEAMKPVNVGDMYADESETGTETNEETEEDAYR